MKALSRLDLINWYCTPLLTGLGALSVWAIIGPWAVIVLGFGLQMHWLALKVLIALMPLALFVALGMLAYRQAHGVPRLHVVSGFVLGALGPMAYAAQALWPRFS